MFDERRWQGGCGPVKRGDSSSGYGGVRSCGAVRRHHSTPPHSQLEATQRLGGPTAPTKTAERRRGGGGVTADGVTPVNWRSSSATTSSPPSAQNCSCEGDEPAVRLDSAHAAFSVIGCGGCSASSRTSGGTPSASNTACARLHRTSCPRRQPLSFPSGHAAGRSHGERKCATSATAGGGL